MASLYCGFALCEVDEDGLVHLPSFLSEALAGEASETELLLAKHEIDDCLVGYDNGHLQQLHARSDAYREADVSAGRDLQAHHRRSRHWFGLVERAPRASGAIRIPPVMRHLGHIGASALFVGTGERFEIWDPARALASEDGTLRELAAWRFKPARRRPPRKTARNQGRTTTRRRGR
jgi:DNA-binding transcriptional regulator/RsmH inhibitor MraZ